MNNCVKKMRQKNTGFTLLELLVVLVILGIISLIASAVILNALYKAKDAAVKANVAAAASTLSASMALDDQPAEDAISLNIGRMNDPDGVENNGDEIKSPYDSTLEAYVQDDSGDRGQVAIRALDVNDIQIRGYGRKGADDPPIVARTIRASENAK
jgi:prepilin-type N-terminal cleavage/methylation domain-containing protein